MIIPISERYRIESNRYCWEVQEAHSRKHRRTGKPEIEWRGISWYGSLENACAGLAELCLRTADTRTVAEAVAEARRVAAMFGNAISSAAQPKGLGEKNG